MHNNLDELPVLLSCIYSGIAVGIIYDIFRLMRITANAFMTHVADLLFGIAAVGIAALTLVYADNGTVRLFSLLGIACGALCWQLFPGRLIRMLISRLKNAVKRRTASKDRRR